MSKWRAKLLLLLPLFYATLCPALPDGAVPLTVPAGTLLRVEVMHRTRLLKGRLLTGRLLEPVYADNRLVVPSGAILLGNIFDLKPSEHSKRLEAKFHGDFTPLREPLIQWTVLSRTDGSEFPLQAQSTSGVGSTLYFRTPRPVHTSLARRAWNTFLGRTNSAVNTVKAPHKSERLQKYFWSQMPYHPQYLEEGSQFELALTHDLPLSTNAPQPVAQQPVDEQTDAQKTSEHLLSVHSRLRTDLNSGTAKAGDPVDAVITQPVLDSNNHLVFPQDSILHGRVVRAEPSRRFGRSGTLRFAFDTVSLPSGLRQDVAATPIAIESTPENKLSVDEEGGVAQQTNRSIAAPLIMGLLSASALGDEDGGLGKTAVSSNGFALVGRLAAIGIGSRYVGGAIGAVATGRTVYTRFLAHGKDTHFGEDTEVLLEISPAHAHRMNPVH